MAGGLIGIIIIGLLIWWFIYDYKKKKERVIDGRGYERDGYGMLVHRNVAWKQIYSYPEYPDRFGSYDVHHIDGNKRNNSPENLEILTRAEHITKHGR
jgi:hypothetical protein